MVCSGHETGRVKSRHAKCHPWPLDCHIRVADGLNLTLPIPCPHINAHPYINRTTMK